jgi:hypothetical protein
VTSPIDPIRGALAGRQALIFVHTAEEGRLLAWLGRLAADLSPPVPLWTWTCTRGLRAESQAGIGDLGAIDDRADTRDPASAIQAVADREGPGLFLFQDLPPFLDRPAVVRALRDAYAALGRRPNSALLISSPEDRIPAELRPNLLQLELPPPDAEEIDTLVREVWAESSCGTPSEEVLGALRLALQGLALEDVRHVIHRALAARRLSRDTLLAEIGTAKKSALKGNDSLTYVPDQVAMERIGGLHALKDWIDKRSGLFNRGTAESGLPVPKGLLLMGISGCGKSLGAKLVAHAWGVPLFRLDMNLIYSSLFGTPQASFHRALKAVESVAPAVLWIDEIENGLGVGGVREETANLILSAFLTWMQEKPPLVFVAATANRIDALPAEMIRKGRFDEVFFCDLPSEEERAEIFAVHIRANRGDLERFDLARLARESREWNAAEIEQAAIAGRIDAAREGEAFSTEHILVHARRLVPLAKTMSEQVRYIRDWAWDRATPASGGESVGLD